MTEPPMGYLPGLDGAAIEAMKDRIIGPLLDAAYALGYPHKPVILRYDAERETLTVEPGY